MSNISLAVEMELITAERAARAVHVLHRLQPQAQALHSHLPHRLLGLSASMVLVDTTEV